MPQSVCQQDFPGSQEGQLLQASNQSQTIESVHDNHTLQDGESGHAEESSEIRRLGGFNRLERCLPVGGNLGGASEIYLQFAWSSKLYEFQCLLFGLCITKLLKPVQARLLHQGVRLVMHLDNMLVIAQRREELEGQLQQITSLLETLGFVVNQENSQLATSQTIQYLGFLIDSREIKSG